MRGVNQTSGPGEQAAQAARRLARHPWLERLARVGYAGSGLIHLIIGWIAAQVALGGGGGEADQGGALQAVREAPLGAVLLWICVLGFFALAVFQLLEGIVGGGEAVDRAKAVGKVALVVIATGAYHVYKGVARTFLEDLTTTGGGQVGRGVEWAGIVGYAAKGVALIVMGGLFGQAAWRSDPERATGLDGALKALAQQPLGTGLLLVVALGLILYGLYTSPAPATPGSEPHQPYSRRRRTRSTVWSRPLSSTRVARPRVGAMFSTRLGALMVSQMFAAMSTAASSLSEA